jgi:hypothetical protein
MILSKFSETISKINLKPMPIQIGIRKAPFYKWGRRRSERRRAERYCKRKARG